MMLQNSNLTFMEPQQNRIQESISVAANSDFTEVINTISVMYKDLLLAEPKTHQFISQAEKVHVAHKISRSQRVCKNEVETDQ